MKMKSGIYNKKACCLAMKNTKYNGDGKATISSSDDWVAEPEWDDMFRQMKKEKVCRIQIDEV